MKKVFFSKSGKQVDLIRLILMSAEIKCEILKNSDGSWDVSVENVIYDQAVKEIHHYFQENRLNHKEVIYKKPTIGDQIGSFTGIIALNLFYLFLIIKTDIDHIIHIYNSSAYDILNGDLYRIITSLFIHSGATHILSNSLFLYFFSIYIFAVTGIQTGWFMILISGALGNLLNAFVYQHHHFSIGASTSVFGSLGILVYFQLHIKLANKINIKRALLPVGGGLAILSLYGTGGENVDITAHLFGFLAGFCLGYIYLTYKHLFNRQHIKRYTLFLTLFLIVLSWLSPIYK